MSSELKVLVGGLTYSVSAKGGRTVESTVNKNQAALPDGWKVVVLRVTDATPGIKVPMASGEVTIVPDDNALRVAGKTVYGKVEEGADTSRKVEFPTLCGHGAEVVFTMQRENAKAKGRK